MLNSPVYICVRMCVGVCICLFGVCRCRRPPPPPGIVDARAIHNNDFSQARISSQNKHNPDNAHFQNLQEECAAFWQKRGFCCLCFVASPPSPTLMSRPFCSATALLFPLHPFITRNGLLNRMLCRADLFMFSFSFLKAVINIINIWWYFVWPCREWRRGIEG